MNFGSATIPIDYSICNGTPGFCQLCWNLSGGIIRCAGCNLIDNVNLSINTNTKLCLPCPIGSIKQENECVTKCGIGYSLNANKCVKCNENQFYDLNTEQCLSSCDKAVFFDSMIVVNICKICGANQYLIDSHCFNQCPLGYSPNSQNICIKCTPEQVSVNGECKESCQPNEVEFLIEEFLSCKVCPFNLVKSDNVCIEFCPIGYTINNMTDKVCIRCENNKYWDNGLCKDSCNAERFKFDEPSGINYCYECNYFEYALDNLCLPTCFNGYENNQSSFTCNKCVDKVEYQNRCLNECPFGHTSEVVNHFANLSTCKECSYSMYVVDNNVCLEKCPRGYRTSVYNDNFNTCNKCDEGLYEDNYQCSNNCPITNPIEFYDASLEAFYCISCNYNEVRLDNICFEKCPDGYASDVNNICVNCKSQNKYEENGICVNSCSDYSIDTEDLTINRCILCPHGNSIIDGMCLELCDLGYGSFEEEKISNVKYGSTQFSLTIEYKICKKCPDNQYGLIDYIKYESNCVDSCLTTDKPVSNSDVSKDIRYCDNCEDNGILFVDICVDKCPRGYIDNVTTCVKCVNSYQKDNSCVDVCLSSNTTTPVSNSDPITETFFCDNCEDNGILLVDICVDKCPRGYTDNVTTCVKCINQYQQSDNKCVDVCFPTNTNTPVSNSDLITNTFFCGNCENEGILLVDICVDKCPRGYTDEVGECIKCPDNQYQKDNTCVDVCLVNDSTTPVSNSDPISNTFFCDNCKDNGLLLVDICVDKCPRGYKENNGECIKCPENQYQKDNECVDVCLGTNMPVSNSDIVNNTYFCDNCMNNGLLVVDICLDYCPRGYKDNITECLKCESTSPFESNNNCYESCESINLVVKYDEILNTQYCSACFYEEILFDGICLSNCPFGFLKNNNTCQNCYKTGEILVKNNGIFTCSDACSNNHYIIEDYVLKSLECSLCPFGSNIVDNVCLDECMNGYYSDEENSVYICEKCGSDLIIDYETANKCNNSCSNNQVIYEDYVLGVTLCSYCAYGQKLFDNQVCLEKCPRGYEDKDENFCQKCPYNKLEKNGKCVESCLDPEINENYDKAISIYDSLGNYCVSCNYKEIRFEDVCLSILPFGYGFINKETLEYKECNQYEYWYKEYCHNDCDKVEDLTIPFYIDERNTCVKCNYGLFHKIDKCVEDCGNGMKTDFLIDKCEFCPNDSLEQDKECVKDCDKGYIKLLNEELPYCYRCSISNDYPFQFFNSCLNKCPDESNYEKNAITYPQHPEGVKAKYCELAEIKNNVLPPYLDSDSKYFIKKCVVGYKPDINNNFQCKNICVNKDKFFYNAPLNQYLCYDEELEVEKVEIDKIVKSYALSNGLSIKFEYYYICKDNEWLYNNVCLEDVKYCPIYSYRFNQENNPKNICLECDQSIIWEKEGEATKCIPTCPLSMYHDVATNRCKNCENSNQFIHQNVCVDSCPFRTNLNTKTCVDCPANMYYSLNPNVCDQLCPIGTFVNESLKECIKCPNNQKFYITDTNKCIDKCPLGYISDDLNVCNLINGFYFPPLDKYVENCPSDYIEHTPTKSCKKCLELGLKELLIEGKYTCVENCPSEYIDLNNTCFLCPSKFIIFTPNPTCVPNCLEGFEEKEVSTQSYYKTCSKCSLYKVINNITICVDVCGTQLTSNSNGKCITCIENNQIIHEDKCVSICPENFQSNGTECIAKITEVIIPIDNAKVSACNEDTCFNRGTCSILNNIAVCNCNEGYLPPYCELNTGQLNDSLQILSQSKDVMSNEQINGIINIIDSVKAVDGSNTLDQNLINTFTNISSNQLDKLSSKGVIDENILNMVDTTLQLSNSGINGNSHNNNEIIDKITQVALASKLSGNAQTGVLFSGNSISIQIADTSPESYKNAKENNIPLIDYSDCENKLKELNIIDKDEKIYSINTRVDPKLTGGTQDTLKIKFIDSNGNDVDTSPCDKIVAKIPMKNNKNFDLKKYTFFKDQGIDVLDMNDPFFTDLCVNFEVDGLGDLTLNQRKKKFSQNTSCSEGCEYTGVDNDGFIKCSCDSNLKEFTTKIETSDFDFTIKSNISIARCYSRAIDKIFQNLSFYVFLSSLFIFGVIAIVYNFILPKSLFIDKYLDDILENDFNENELDDDNLKEYRMKNDLNENNPEYIKKNLSKVDINLLDVPQNVGAMNSIIKIENNYEDDNSNVDFGNKEVDEAQVKIKNANAAENRFNIVNLMKSKLMYKKTKRNKTNILNILKNEIKNKQEEIVFIQKDLIHKFSRREKVQRLYREERDKLSPNYKKKINKKKLNIIEESKKNQYELYKEVFKNDLKLKRKFIKYEEEELKVNEIKHTDKYFGTVKASFNYFYKKRDFELIINNINAIESFIKKITRSELSRKKLIKIFKISNPNMKPNASSMEKSTFDNTIDIKDESSINKKETIKFNKTKNLENENEMSLVNKKDSNKINISSSIIGEKLKNKESVDSTPSKLIVKDDNNKNLESSKIEEESFDKIDIVDDELNNNDKYIQNIDFEQHCDVIEKSSIIHDDSSIFSNIKNINYVEYEFENEKYKCINQDDSSILRKNESKKIGLNSDLLSKNSLIDSEMIKTIKNDISEIKNSKNFVCISEEANKSTTRKLKQEFNLLKKTKTKKIEDEPKKIIIIDEKEMPKKKKNILSKILGRLRNNDDKKDENLNKENCNHVKNMNNDSTLNKTCDFMKNFKNAIEDQGISYDEEGKIKLLSQKIKRKKVKTKRYRLVIRKAFEDLDNFFKIKNYNFIKSTFGRRNLLDKFKEDESTFFEYLWVQLKENHVLFNLIFFKSILYPFELRLLTFFYETSLSFSLNAIFYDEVMIEARSELQEKGTNPGFWYTFAQNFYKSFICAIIPIFFMKIVGCLIEPSEKANKEFQKILSSKNKLLIKLS
jgi:hypothetical protein